MIKKVTYILILIIISANFALAKTQNACVEYNGYKYKFKTGDEAIFAKNASANIFLAEKAQDVHEKIFRLQEALRYYFLLSKVNPKSLDAQIGQARVYDGMMLDKFAKEHFFMALDIDRSSPKANFYFANYYFKRADYINALYYYKLAYKYGYSRNFETNYNMGIIHEKLADVEMAKNYYANALNLKPDNEELANKIRLLDDLNYNQSQYYLFNKNNK